MTIVSRTAIEGYDKWINIIIVIQKYLINTVKFCIFTKFVDPKPSSLGSFNQLYPTKNITS